MKIDIIQHLVGEKDHIDVIEYKPVVKGEWWVKPISQLWHCTACGHDEIRTTKYCPNCGAEMAMPKSEYRDLFKDKNIVHCGECKYADRNTLFCTLHSCNPTESDYCSWGERE